MNEIEFDLLPSDVQEEYFMEFLNDNPDHRAAREIDDCGCDEFYGDAEFIAWLGKNK